MPSTFQNTYSEIEYLSNKITVLVVFVIQKILFAGLYTLTRSTYLYYYLLYLRNKNIRISLLILK